MNKHNVGSREIEFRGRDLNTGEWRYGHYYCTYDGDQPHIITMGGHEWRVDPKTVSQYTGQKDDNSTKLFEGDIIVRNVLVLMYRNLPKDDRPHNGTEWVNQNFIVSIPEIYSQQGIRKIIGNVFENPELLENN